MVSLPHPLLARIIDQAYSADKLGESSRRLPLLRDIVCYINKAFKSVGQELLYDKVIMTSAASLSLFNETVVQHPHLASHCVELHVLLPVGMKSGAAAQIRQYKMLGRVLCRDDTKRGHIQPSPKSTLISLYGALISLQRITIAGQTLGDVVQSLHNASFRQTLTSFTFIDAILSPRCMPFREISAKLPRLDSFHLAEWKEEKLNIHAPVKLDDAMASLGLGGLSKVLKFETEGSARNINSLHMRRFQWSDNVMERELGICKGRLTELRMIIPSHNLDGLRYIARDVAGKLEHLALDLPGNADNADLDNLTKLLLGCNNLKQLSVSTKRLSNMFWVVCSPSITHLTLHGLDFVKVAKAKSKSKTAHGGDLTTASITQYIKDGRSMTNLKTFIYDPYVPEVAKLAQMVEDAKSTTRSDIDMLHGISAKLDFARQPFLRLGGECDKRQIAFQCPAQKALQKMQVEVDRVIASLKRELDAEV